MEMARSRAGQEAEDADAGLVLSLTGKCSEWTFAAVAIRECAGKGLGAFACHDIKKGERLLSELPLIHWNAPANSSDLQAWAQLDERVRSLDAEMRAAFWALMQGGPLWKHPKCARGVWLSNAYPAGDVASCVYGRASRFNHACVPSAHCEWNPELGRQTIHAFRDIAQGEEITVLYCDGYGQTQAVRQGILHDNFGFYCRCGTCLLGGKQRAQSDARQQRIGAIYAALPSLCTMEPTQRERSTRLANPRLRDLVEERSRLVEAEGMVEIGDILWQLAECCRRVGDHRGVAHWSSRAAKKAYIALGDSPVYRKYAAATM